MSPIFVAIDTPDLHRALALGKSLGGTVGGLKLGLEFFVSNGPAGVAEIASLGLPIFLDLKLHDIPNTVARAVAALARLAPAILTVHATGGHEMLLAAKQAAPPATRVVAVTMLTSLDQADLGDLGITWSPRDQVTRLARLARDAGVDGIVCSGAEVADAKAEWPNGFFVVPGLRPAGAEIGDQKRVATPQRALQDGASVLVIGRPITAAPNPAEAIRDIAASLRTNEQART